MTTMPIEEHCFYFHDFHDHIRLRYCWPLDNLPVSCPCGARFNVDHAQICKLSGFIHVRHNDPTDFIATCMKEVHHDVELEPLLQPLTGEQLHLRTANTDSGARADLRVKGFWTDSRNAFFDTRVFIPMRQAIGPDLFHHCTGGSKEKKNVSMVSASMRLSTAPSHR